MNKKAIKTKIASLIKSNHINKSLDLINQLVPQSKDPEIYYLAGMAYGASFNYYDALISFEKAIELDPKYVAPYLEIGIIHVTLCRYNKAIKFLKKALQIQPNLQEALYYLSEIKKVIKPEDVHLSGCLIVKNEEKHLHRCLTSIRSICDEIIVVDTGSTDRTVEIAHSFGAKVFYFPWKKDFAAARNFAIEKASGDWIIQIDADEELFLEDQFKVRELIHQGQCDAAFVAINNRNSTVFGENLPTVHYLIRIYRNRKDIYYVNPIHEILKVPGKILPTDINFLHHGYNLDFESMKKKRKRNAEILYRRYKEDPDNVTTNFYLSMMHLGNQEYEKSQFFAERVVNKLNPQNLAKQHIYLMCLNNLAFIAVNSSQFKQAEKYCLEAIQLNENYLDPYFFLGLAYYRMQNYKSAKDVFLAYLKKFEQITLKPVFNLFSQSQKTHLYQVYHLLGKIYRKEKNYKEAEQMMRYSVALNPQFWIGYADLAYLNMDLKKWETSLAYLDKAIKIAKNNSKIPEDNAALKFDFTNMVKNYLWLLKKINRQKMKVV